MPSSSPTSEGSNLPGAPTMEGASTPEMFETLQGAQAGGDGPGKVNDTVKKVNGTTSSDIKPGSMEELYPKRAVLTTYPNTFGIAPFPLQWGAETAQARGPIICSRIPTSLPLRNAIGAHSGSYSIYRALSIAMKLLPSNWRPDLTDTEPPFQIGPHEAWTGKDKNGLPRIVSLDPWGALSQEIWAKEFKDGIDIRPTISQTKAHIKIQEIDELYKSGKLKIDGNIVIKSPELPAFPGVHQGIEVNCFKAALDPVWYLPGVAARLGVQESTLRRALFEDTGGMYPELLTRPDLKVFLPPIGGQTVYIFGNPDYLSDETKELTFRPYLIFGIEEAIRCAQRGGVGVLIYFRKEGRALGEVTKYLVYNLRKRTGDSAERYFKSTELIAGVKDQRFQALSLPDTIAWLGIKKIDNLISMSNMKYEAIIEHAGCKVINRYELPEELMPPDSAVEIHAKIAAGYFSGKSKAQVDENLKATKGRGWEDIAH
ncbi:hypothetical protein QFC22_000308 [Naganishia vaughanmartiniae]|uniref:Uncharacterized protein n=1 Tax=Naganishia vaughanmartiniae TaxID=1424756 RepID=A0ACC2XMY7_9TREE|nr:hypothetical protein QFC22_000308 [Naganishia vaughanmartiniae]